MAIMDFYHSERLDNGKRTGLTINQDMALERFVPGNRESDPRLRWDFDVILTEKSPPKTERAALKWFAEHADTIKAAIEEASRQLENGMDKGLWSFEQHTDFGPVRVSVWAMKRFDARAISKRLQKFLDHDWHEFVADPVPAE